MHKELDRMKHIEEASMNNKEKLDNLIQLGILDENSDLINHDKL